MPSFVSISVLNNQRFDKMYSAYVCFRSACLDINLCTNLWVLRLGDVTCDLWSSSFLDRLNIGGMASSGRPGRASSLVPRSWDAWAPSWARAWIRREPGTPPAGTWTRWVWWPAGCAVPSNTAGIEREVFRDNRLGLAGGAGVMQNSCHSSIEEMATYNLLDQIYLCFDYQCIQWGSRGCVLVRGFVGTLAAAWAWLCQIRYLWVSPILDLIVYLNTDTIRWLCWSSNTKCNNAEIW